MPHGGRERASDRVIGIFLGILLGVAIVIAFVFLGSRSTIDAPSLSGDQTQTQEQTPAPDQAPAPQTTETAPLGPPDQGP